MNTLFHEVCSDVVDDCTVHSALCPVMMLLMLLRNLNLVKAMDMTGYHQIIIVMVPHYHHVIFPHYIIV